MVIDRNAEASLEASFLHRQHTVEILDVQQTTCCIVGGGPAGAVLALLLARKGVEVMLLEKHSDFDRDFRGDTLHPPIMELMDQLGLAGRLLKLPHTKIRTMRGTFGPTNQTVISFRNLKTKFPYITFMPQVEFLNFVTEEAKHYPNFHLLMNANVQQLVEADGRVRGVRYHGLDGWHEIRALLTVGADGRFSRVRHLAGMEPVSASQPIDVLWFRLSRRPEDGDGAFGIFRGGAVFIMLNRNEQWQIAYAIPKGSYQKIRSAGLDYLRQEIARGLPKVADHVQELKDWKQFSLLSVESSRVKQWYKPGLLLIGDAAHVISPIAGVGINYAIQDSIAAANVLTRPLLRKLVTTRDLAEVQRQREWPVKVVQASQAFIQERILKPGLDSGKSPSIPRVVRLPIVRYFLARMVAFGVRPVHLKP